VARLGDDEEEGISLFPMFNILACTLGVMVFILSTEATVSLGADKAVEMVAELDSISGGGERVPPGEREPRTPIWLEWDGTRLGMLPSGDAVTFDRALNEIPTWESTFAYVSSVLSGSRLGSTIAQVGLDPHNRYVVLIVRPSGFDSLLEIRRYIEFLGIDVGYEPIDQRWQRVGVR